MLSITDVKENITFNSDLFIDYMNIKNKIVEHKRSIAKLNMLSKCMNPTLYICACNYELNILELRQQLKLFHSNEKHFDELIKLRLYERKNKYFVVLTNRKYKTIMTIEQFINYEKIIITIFTCRRRYEAINGYHNLFLFEYLLRRENIIHSDESMQLVIRSIIEEVFTKQIISDLNLCGEVQIWLLNTNKKKDREIPNGLNHIEQFIVVSKDRIVHSFVIVKFDNILKLKKYNKNIEKYYEQYKNIENINFKLRRRNDKILLSILNVVKNKVYKDNIILYY